MDYQEAIDTLKDEIKCSCYRNRGYCGICTIYSEIDRDKIIDACKCAISAMQELQAYKKIGTLEEVREAVEKQKWIPCSERLPENISHVIVQVKEIEKPTIGWYGSMYGWRLTERDFADLKNFTVIAWKPFPEPYRPDKCHGCFGAENNDCEGCVDEE